MTVRFASIDDNELAKCAPLHWREKSSQMRFEKDRRRELVSGGLVATMLDLVEPEIEVAENGKPRIKGRPELHFNLSHSGGLVMVVVAEDEVGCDIEEIRELSPELKSAIGSLDRWVLREAAYKCYGREGLEKLASPYPAPLGYIAAICQKASLK